MMIEIDSLQYRWRKDAPLVLDIPQFSLAKGEHLFIRGASGSGKSTLLSLLGGVMLPQQGDLRVLGQSLPSMRGVARDAFRADHIGFIFQMFNLIPYLSVIDNVILPCRFSKLRQQRVLSSAATLQDEARRLLGQLDIPADLHARPATELSVGQQQRVAAARALMGSPELVIADEPTSALDADRREVFLNLLFKECEHEHVSLVFVSHDASLQPLFSRSLDLAEINRAASRELA